VTVRGLEVGQKEMRNDMDEVIKRLDAHDALFSGSAAGSEIGHAFANPQGGSSHAPTVFSGGAASSNWMPSFITISRWCTLDEKDVAGITAGTAQTWLRTILNELPPHLQELKLSTLCLYPRNISFKIVFDQANQRKSADELAGHIRAILGTEDNPALLLGGRVAKGVSSEAPPHVTARRDHLRLMKDGLQSAIVEKGLTDDFEGKANFFGHHAFYLMNLKTGMKTLVGNIEASGEVHYEKPTIALLGGIPCSELRSRGMTMSLK
jgi:hypothetical protein